MSCQKKLEDHNARRRVGFQSRDGSNRRSDNTISGNRSSSSSMNLPTPSTILPLPDQPSGQPTSALEALAAVLAPPAPLPPLSAVLSGTALPSSVPGLTAASWLPRIERQTTVPPNPAINDVLLSTILQLLQSTDQQGSASATSIPNVPGSFPEADGQAQLLPQPTSAAVGNPQYHSLLENLSTLFAARSNPHDPSSVAIQQPSSTAAATPGPQTGFIPHGAASISPPQLHSYASNVSQPSLPLGAQNINRMSYVPESQLVRISIKLFGCEPSDLDPGVREDLESLIRTDADQLEAYVRPGCAHVTLDVRLPAGRRPPKASDAVSIADVLLQRNASGEITTRALAPFLVQVGNEVAVGLGPSTSSNVPMRTVVRHSAELGALMPELLPPEPRVVVAGHRTTVTLRGRGLSKQSDLPMCRQHGSNVTLDVLGSSENPIGVAENAAAADDDDGEVAAEMESRPSKLLQGDFEWVDVRPLGLVPGCAEFEVEQGTLLSHAVPLLVLPDSEDGRAAAAEVGSGLKSSSRVNLDNEYQFLRDVGIVLHYLCSERELTGCAKSFDGKLRPVVAANKLVSRLVETCDGQGWTALSGLLKRAK